MNQLATIDDKRAPADSAHRIREEHRLALQCRDSAIEHATEAGRLLLMVKQRLGHGEFIPWVEAHCGLKYSTAARYVTAAKQISTGVEISSLRSVFPSGRLPRTKSSPAEGSTAIDDSRSAILCDPPRRAATAEPDDGAPYLEEDGEPSEEEIAELDAMIAAGEPEEPAGFYLGGAVPKVLPEGERLKQFVTALEQRRDESMTLAHNRLELLKRKTHQCNELETQVRHWRSRVEELEHCEQENEELRKRVADLEVKNEALRERISIMEETA